MFLFAKLVMRNLHDQLCRTDLEAEMKDGVFPNGLDAAYVFWSFTLP